MPQLKYKVKYISNSCTQIDELLNRPHLSVAESLFDLLQNHREIQHPVVGLEGSWGSGKSQVINILQKLISDKNLSSKYKFLTYDIWSAQEDLTRRSFLDSVLSDVKEDDAHFETEQLKKDYEKLNATTTIRSTKSFPLVRVFFASLLLIPIMLFIVNAIEAFFGYRKGAIWTYDELRGFLSLALSALSLFSFVLAYREEKKVVNADQETANKSWWDKFQIVIGRLFYVFKAKDIEKTDYETIMKDEPSISRFQTIFNHVYNSLKNDATLVIVFDNMDRLSDSQKLMSTWSLLHTFFAEGQYQGKVWALVPYAKKQLSEVMNGAQSENKKTSEFINKTFFTSFRIPEPIMGSWKEFLNNKLDEAFTPRLNDDDKNYVTLIFSRTTAGQPIRPRDIIAYVNRLVALYSQHYFEDIPMRYIALYAQYEAKIDENPVDCILNFKGLEPMVSFVGKEDISKWLSSIYYNLPSSKSLEVVYDREIKTFLQYDYDFIDGKYEALEAYNILSANDHFHNHIEEFFNKELDLSELKLENIFYLLDKDSITLATRNRIYSIVSEQLSNLKDQLLQYESWMENAFLTYSIDVTNLIVKALLQNAKDSFDTHYSTVVPLLRLQQKRPSIQLHFNTYKTESPKEMLEYHDYLKEENATDLFKKAKVVIDSAKLLEYMKEGVTGNLLFGYNTDKVYGLLQLMKVAKHDLTPISEAISSASIPLANQEHVQVERIYRVYNIVTEKKHNIPNFTLIDANATKFLDIPEYLACTLVQLKNNGNNKNSINNCLSGLLKADKESLISILPTYFYFDSILKVAMSSDNGMLKTICRLLVESGRGTISSSDQILSDTSNIIQVIFESEEESFLSYLDTRIEQIEKGTKVDFINVDSYWRDHISQNAMEKHPIFKTICNKWLAEFTYFIDSTWNDEFTTDSGNVSLVLQKLDEIGVISADFWNNIPKDPIYKAFTQSVINGATLDTVLFKKWKSYASKATLAKLANDTLYSITNPKSIKDVSFISFVELLWENSEIIKNETRADGIYDDYISEYLSKDAKEQIGSFIYNHISQVDTFIRIISDDRKKLIVDQIEKISKVAQEGSAALTALENLITTYRVDNNASES